MTTHQTFPSSYEGLLQLVQHLRGQDGCSWDREQTRDSLKAQLLEECYELLEAIEQGDTGKLVEELGDVLLHVAFQTNMGEESGEFTQEQVFHSLVDKLVRRHPHVFADVRVANASEVEARWDAIKHSEREDPDASILGGVPRSMSALSYAQTIQRRAARLGFDWEEYRGVVAKVSEELEELDKAETETDRERELGDVLFSIVNVARWLDMDAEGALRHASSRFFSRFSIVEKLCRERGFFLPDQSLEEKEALWQEAKGMEG